MAEPANPFNQQQAIPGVKKIVAVSSGKGGVGKSTVAVNLAMALSKKNKVGLLDADIYGPSLPRMMGALNQKPAISADQKLEPLVRHGVRMMSMGFIVPEDAAVVWRGPMLFKAMDQLIRDVKWGELDYLIVDLPPGTGDVQLSLAQKVPVAGTVVVTTPQNIAFADVKKAVDMWSRVGVKVLGFAENMAWMKNPANGEKIQLYPKGELDSYADAKGLKKLAQIPFDPSVGLACEAGVPIVEADSGGDEAQAFFALAEAVRNAAPL